MKTYVSDRLGERYTEEKLPCGLTLLSCPLTGFRGCYAGLTASLGSIDNEFSVDGGPMRRVPDGLAHFLEHKLFESEDGDAFEKYAKTGANANAFTSFTNTNYVFSCTSHFLENLRILLGFVFHPWFTPESVRKEQGIIGQEIEMYGDDPDWQGYSLLLDSLYSAVPLGTDIAGSRRSIAQITPTLLYDACRAFYNPSNLTLTVAGNIDTEAVRALCAELVPSVPPVAVTRPVQTEPREIVRSRAERRMAVSLPQFNIGFKEAPLSPEERAFRPVLAEILVDMLVSDVSPLYRRLYDAGLISDAFSYEVMTCREHWLISFSGESRDPEAVLDALCCEFERARREGLSRAMFERSRKAMYGRLVKSFSAAEDTASTILDFYFSNGNVYDIIEKTAVVRFEDAEAMLSDILHGEYAAMSVIRPDDEAGGTH